jgi:hypothetical protein
MGFHSPAESLRVLGLAIAEAQKGQLQLQQELTKRNLFMPAQLDGGMIPAPGAPISSHVAPVGQTPPAGLPQ